VQELFQCKLTRKGTLAPSDRQSKLRKSISINNYSKGEDDSDNLYETNNNNKVQFSNSTITSSYSSMTSYKSLTNKLSNKDDNNNNTNNKTLIHSLNQYASDKALPLTVACHFKVNIYLIDISFVCLYY
jgi:hypothetical protein